MDTLRLLADAAEATLQRETTEPLPAWTFPHEWHAQADRVVVGGVRESGPA
jgi:hypothetical protein